MRPAPLNRLGGLGDPAARGTGRGYREQDLPVARGRRGLGVPAALQAVTTCPLPGRKRAPGAGPRGTDPSLRHEALRFAKRTLLVLKAKGIR